MHGLCPLSSLLDSEVRGAGALIPVVSCDLVTLSMLGLQFPVSKVGITM